MTLHDTQAAIVAEPGCISTFAWLKRDDAEQFTLPIGNGLGQLIPVTERHDGDAQLLEVFGRWRTENSFAFPTQFPVTTDGTARWLRRGLLDVRDRLLFLLHAADGTLVGHLGYANCLASAGEMEIDNVVRGVKGAHPGIMEAAMFALTKWADDAFAPSLIFLRVFSHNEHAVRFYERCGFTAAGLLPLRRTVEGDRITFGTPSEGDIREPDAFFLRMELRRRQIQSTDC